MYWFRLNASLGAGLAELYGIDSITEFLPQETGHRSLMIGELSTLDVPRDYCNFDSSNAFPQAGMIIGAGSIRHNSSSGIGSSNE